MNILYFLKPATRSQ